MCVRMGAHVWQSYRFFRMNVGHELNHFDEISGLPLAVRICSNDATLSVGTGQADIYSSIVKYEMYGPVVLVLWYAPHVYVQVNMHACARTRAFVYVRTGMAWQSTSRNTWHTASHTALHLAPHTNGTWHCSHGTAHGTRHHPAHGTACGTAYGTTACHHTRHLAHNTKAAMSAINARMNAA